MTPSNVCRDPNSAKSSFVDYATAPYHDHEAAKNPVKPVLSTACLKQVYARIRLAQLGMTDKNVVTDGATLVRLFKDVLGLVDHGETLGTGKGKGTCGMVSYGYHILHWMLDL